MPPCVVLFNNLKDKITDYENLHDDSDLLEGYIGYEATYHNLTISVYIEIDEYNSDQLFIRYIYYYQIPNAQVNP